MSYDVADKGLYAAMFDVIMPSTLHIVFILQALAIVSTTQKTFCPANCICDQKSNTVNCRNAGLTQIPWVWTDPLNLQWLDLSRNDISEVPLPTVSYPNLEVLDLSHNRIISINDDVLSVMPQLKSLYLNNNDIIELTSRTLRGLMMLRVLDLSNNQIKVVFDGVFADLASLVELNLSANGRIVLIREDSFIGLKSLRILNLGYNRLSAIPVSALKTLPWLTKLYLHRNSLELVPTHAFKMLAELRELHLEDNYITEIADTAFFDNKKVDTPSLELLNLKGNHLLEVPTRAIHKLDNVIDIDLSENLLCILHPDSFRGLKHLQRISLNSLPDLTLVRKYAFSELHNLEVVEMHSNRGLREIEEGTFLATPRLRKVDLHGNKLRRLHTRSLEWKTLEEVDLRLNPWECDCSLTWLLAVLPALGKKANTSRDLTGEVQCATPEVHAGKSILKLDPRAMACPNKGGQFDEGIRMAIVAAVSSVLLCVMMYLLVKNNCCNMSGKHSRQPANCYTLRMQWTPPSLRWPLCCRSTHPYRLDQCR